MLRELVVDGLGVIERAETELGPGSVALTGETGAGKTLVVAALGLLLGGRADRSLIRSGSPEARVEGLFVLPNDHSVVRTLIDHGVLEETHGEVVELLISRSIGLQASSSKARINGRLVTAGLLTELSGRLVEIAGQHEHQRLGAPAYQRAVLDSFAGHATVELAGRLREVFRTTTALDKELEDLEMGERGRLRELDALRSEIEQIEGAAPTPGERARLMGEAERLEFAAAIAEGVDESLVVLRGEAGIEELAGRAEGLVRALSDHDPVMDGLADRIEATRHELADVAEELRGRAVGPDPHALEETRARLDELAKLRRRYGDTEEEILAHLETCRTRKETIEGMAFNAESLRERRDAARAESGRLAEELSAARSTAAPQLAAEVQRRMSSLALPEASFNVALEEQDLAEAGAERVSFLWAANPGESSRPVGKAASGGELSRLALALHLAVSMQEVTPPTMVFDEVDAGVGGEAARAVGRALADLARSSGGQVVVVTHLPQVAAFADVHLKVEKSIEGSSTRASVSLIDGEERVAELSRMLAGLPGSETAQGHARELLDLASSEIPVA